MRAWSLLAAALLLLQQPLWHWLLYPGPVFDPWLTTAIAGVPVAIGVFATWQGSRYGLLLASVIAMIYFCHGTTELIASPTQWPMAVTGILLSLWLFFSLWFRLRGKV